VAQVNVASRGLVATINQWEIRKIFYTGVELNVKPFLERLQIAYTRPVSRLAPPPFEFQLEQRFAEFRYQRFRFLLAPVDEFRQQIHVRMIIDLPKRRVRIRPPLRPAILRNAA